MNQDLSYQRVEQAYSSYVELVKTVNRVLDGCSKMPELTEEFLRIRELSRDIDLLFEVQADKRLPTNVGAESVSSMDLFLWSNPAHAKVRKAQARKMAKTLYTKAHPDHGGESSVFVALREAVNAGDVETIHVLRFRLDPSTTTQESVDVAEQAILTKTARFKGSQIFKLVALFYSNNERFVTEAKLIFKKKITELEIQRTGFVPD